MLSSNLNSQQDLNKKLFSLCRLPVLRTITFGFSILNLLVKTNLTNGQCSQNCTQPWFQTSYQFCHHQTLSMKVGQDFSINFKFNKDHFITCFLLLLSLMVAQWVRSLYLTAHTSLSAIRRGFAPSFVNCKKGCTRLAVASDKVYWLLAQGRWFSPGTPASSTTKTGHWNIAESGVNTPKIKSNQSLMVWPCSHSHKGNGILMDLSMKITAVSFFFFHSKTFF
jgi:hypothetical protein